MRTNVDVDYGDKDLFTYSFLCLFIYLFSLSFQIHLTGNDSRRVNNSTTQLLPGLERARRLNEICDKLKENMCKFPGRKSPYCRAATKVRVDYNKEHKAMFCPMCKVASTFWTRVFRMLVLNARKDFKRLRTPYDVPISDAPASKFYFNIDKQVVDQNEIVEFKFIFVRDPFSLLFSAYVDKIIGPNPIYWKEFGEAASRLRGEKSKVCGADLTFNEFIDHVVHRFKAGKSFDCHFAKYAVCNPCSVRYDFIGKMESFKTDTFDILSILHQDETVLNLKKNISELHDDDAIEDSVSGPFAWKSDIIKCISWHEALKRIWRKLQIRGILGSAHFPLSAEESEIITEKDFITLLISTRKGSTSQARKHIKDKAYIDAYKNVNKKLLYDIKTVYKEEFELFDYPDIPLLDNLIKNSKPQIVEEERLLNLSKI